MLANYEFVAWSAGVLYYLASELVFKQASTCLVSWKNKQVTIEDVWFKQENGKVGVLQEVGSTIQV